MNDKEFREQKRRITNLIDKWMVPLGLRWWTVKFVYSRDSVEHRDDGRCCVAQTLVDWHYLNATVTWDMQAVADEADDDLEKEFVHECSHILVNEMRMWAGKEMDEDKNDEAMHHEERVVTQMANAFIWTREAGRDDVKKTKPARQKRKK